MKKLFIFLCALALTFSVSAQVQQKSDVKNENRDDRIFSDPIANAHFPGGDEACMRWLRDHIKYPEDCKKRMIEGRVQVSFVVDVDGSITDIKIRRSPHPSLSKESIRLVKAMPKWTPSWNYETNLPLRSLYFLTINFRFPEQARKIELDADGVMRVGAPITIVTIGNSITAGYSNTSSYWAWPAQFGRMIGPDYEVKNYAVSGTTMNQHINASFRKTDNYPKAKAANPDILVIGHGTNDAHVGWWKSWGQSFCDDYRSMVASFRENDRNPILFFALAPPVFSEARAEQNKNIEEEVIPRVKQLAAELGATTIDFHTPFVGKKEFFPDNVHPSDPGAERMAEIVQEVMAPLRLLTSQITAENGTVISPTMAVIESGSSVTLMPESDTKGTWRWSGPKGFTSTHKALKLKKLTSGGVYKVHFQDKEGNRGVLNYLISIRGQKAGTITPYASVAGEGWKQDTLFTVQPGQDLTFGPSSSEGNEAGTWAWRGPNGFFSFDRQVTVSTMNAAKAGQYGVTYTDAEGRQSSVIYTIKVEGERVCPKLVGYGHNEDGWKQTNTIAVKPGTPVTFAPHPQNGKWSWTGPNGFRSHERHNQIFDFDASMVGDYEATYTNEAGCREKLVMTLTLAGDSTKEKEQKALPKVYDEDINPMTQIDKALSKAKSEGKNVICQVGGNWCPWCLRFADFITNDTAISKVIDDNFVYIHVNYNPRKEEGAEKAKLTNQMMDRLNNPARFGFPVFVVLDSKGKVLHTQDSSFLEEGKGYNQEKVLRFLKSWTPKSMGL